MGTCGARRSRRQVVGNFPCVLALMCVLFWALETRTEEVTCSVDFDYCLVCCCAWAASFPRPIRQDFDSPFDLAPLSERALDDFGQVHLIPQRTPGAGLHASLLLRPGLQGPKRMRTRFMEDVWTDDC